MDVKNDLLKILFAVAASFWVPSSAETLYCGPNIVCHGDNPYCCILDSGARGCCWDTYVYELWWFWFVWVVLFFLLAGCSMMCWRRRQRRIRYVVMANSEYPTYGTVVHTGTNTGVTPYNSSNPPVYPTAVPTTAPVAPPSYASKPPPYSG